MCRAAARRGAVRGAALRAAMWAPHSGLGTSAQSVTGHRANGDLARARTRHGDVTHTAKRQVISEGNVKRQELIQNAFARC